MLLSAMQKTWCRDSDSESQTDDSVDPGQLESRADHTTPNRSGWVLSIALRRE